MYLFHYNNAILFKFDIGTAHKTIIYIVGKVA